MPETMKLFGSTKKLIHKTKNCENIPSLEIVKVVLAQCNSVDNQYQQKSMKFYTKSAKSTSSGVVRKI